MEIFLSPQAWLGAALIFGLRVADMTLDTLRVLVVMRGKKGLAWVLGFFQALIFVVAISSVLKNLDNPLNILGYAAGFATGILTGMWLESRMAVGYTHLRVISPRRGAELAERLREAGFAVTEISGMGRDGVVNLLSCNVLRKQAGQLESLVQQIDPEAFMTAEDVRKVDGGFWG
jgi:uncharacterized protein YebE (UPF0316 family)